MCHHCHLPTVKELENGLRDNKVDLERAKRGSTAYYDLLVERRELLAAIDRARNRAKQVYGYAQ